MHEINPIEAIQPPLIEEKPIEPAPEVSMPAPLPLKQIPREEVKREDSMEIENEEDEEEEIPLQPK